MKMSTILFFIALTLFAPSTLYSQEISGTEGMGGENDKEEYGLETRSEIALRHYELCDLKRKFRDSVNKERDKKLKEEYKNKKKGICRLYSLW